MNCWFNKKGIEVIYFFYAFDSLLKIFFIFA